ncbi:hypothetical protein AgCh_029026 [Apium graveolens]
MYPVVSNTVFFSNIPINAQAIEIWLRIDVAKKKSPMRTSLNHNSRVEASQTRTSKRSYSDEQDRTKYTVKESNEKITANILEIVKRDIAQSVVVETLYLNSITEVMSQLDSMGYDNILIRGFIHGTRTELVENLCAMNFIVGDFNVVRVSSERLNCDYKENDSVSFNDFIEHNDLHEVRFVNSEYTWCGRERKHNKLDIALLNWILFDIWDWSVQVLDMKNSDHRAIILGNKFIEGGPKLFKIFYCWLDDQNLRELLERSWQESGTDNVQLKSKKLRRIVSYYNKLENGNADSFFKIAKKDQFLADEDYAPEEVKKEMYLRLQNLYIMKSKMLRQKSRLSLINFTMKLIVKMMAERLKRVLPKLVSEVQTGSMQVRHISDGILVASKVVRSLKAKSSRGIVLKVDFEKAFDTIKWSFLL